MSKGERWLKGGKWNRGGEEKRRGKRGKETGEYRGNGRNLF